MRRFGDEDTVHRFPPATDTLQGFTFYEIGQRLYVIAEDSRRIAHRILKIDRAASHLQITEDSMTYSRLEVDVWLRSLADGRTPATSLRRTRQCVALFGAIQVGGLWFMAIANGRRLLGYLGPHAIYAPEQWEMYPISNRKPTSDDTKYLSMINSLDYVRDAFFSYTLDVTRTVQDVMSARSESQESDNPFVWNDFMLSNTGSQLRHWFQVMGYGYFRQQLVSLGGQLCALTLVARRSFKFAGTRYRKRGISEAGYAANEVEIEQVLQNLSYGSILSVPTTSYVQVRGSIPVYWSQDSQGVVPKPDIRVDRVDPFYVSTRLHFARLLQRHGYPVCVLNLVKQEEKKKRESILGSEYAQAVDMLNVTMPSQAKIRYTAFDIHHVAKHASIMDGLNALSETVIDMTGFFHTGGKTSPCYCRCRGGLHASMTGSGCEQLGVVRTNCIDSLDRTNVAQYIIGNRVLAMQAEALGLHSHREISTFLREMYEELGDQLAMQYCGSAAVKSAARSQQQHERSLALVAAHGRDMLTSLKRFYSSTFVDATRQDAMNVLHGVYRFQTELPHVWQLVSDRLLHATDPVMPQAPVDWHWAHDAILRFLREFHFDCVPHEIDFAPSSAVVPDSEVDLGGCGATGWISPVGVPQIKGRLPSGAALQSIRTKYAAHTLTNMEQLLALQPISPALSDPYDVTFRHRAAPGADPVQRPAKPVEVRMEQVRAQQFYESVFAGVSQRWPPGKSPAYTLPPTRYADLCIENPPQQYKEAVRVPHMRFRDLYNTDAVDASTFQRWTPRPGVPLVRGVGMRDGPVPVDASFYRRNTSASVMAYCTMHA